MMAPAFRALGPTHSPDVHIRSYRAAASVDPPGLRRVVMPKARAMAALKRVYLSAATMPIEGLPFSTFTANGPTTMCAWASIMPGMA